LGLLKTLKEEDMRIFLIIFSAANTLLYILVFAYFDYILSVLGTTSLSPGLISFLKILFLLVIGACIGFLVSLLAKERSQKTYYDYKLLIIIGIVPFLCLILSEGTVTNFIITRFFSSNKRLSELVFYLFSRQVLYSLWLGFAAGISTRFGFQDKKIYKHVLDEPGNTV
jgi:hypothetical protein